MTAELTYKLNEQNRRVVADQIRILQSSFNPYVATENLANSVITDRDHFPYSRFYRSNPMESVPIIMEREAGFRPVDEACYDAPNRLLMYDKYPAHCFQTPCSTVKPCVPGLHEDLIATIFAHPPPLPVEDEIRAPPRRHRHIPHARNR